MPSTLAAACLICDTALSGPLSALSRLGGVRRSRGNPNLCTRCNGHLEEGRIVELAVFFADLSGYTAMTETLGPDRVHVLLDAYLRRATDVIVQHDGFVSQFVGDEVMAFFNAPITRDDYPQRAVRAGRALQRAVAELAAESGHTMDVTIGIAAGHARVGRVGSESIAHYSAIGDVVNRAARLVSRVSPGGMLVDESIHRRVADRFPEAVRQTVALKGFRHPVEVALLQGDPVVPTSADSAATESRTRLGTTLAALLSAPCVGYLALNAVALWLGFGTLAAGALGTFLDQSFIRVPLLVAAGGGALAILAVVRRHHREATRAEGLAATPTPFERHRNRTGVLLAVGALLLVVGEVIAHEFVH